jgi:diguanylate cyclase (GGDEF)-like protein
MKKLIPALVLMMGYASAAFAGEPGALTTIAAIRALNKAEASQALPVAFEATVTYFHPGFRYLFVQDGDQAIFVYAPVGVEVVAGDRILIKGVTHAEFSSDVLGDSITLLHHGDLPSALPASFDDLMSGKLDCRLVTIRGQVRAANLVLRPDVRSPITFTKRVAYLEVLADGGYIDVIVNSTDASILKNLLDAEVEVTGAGGGIYDGKWHQTGTLVRTFSFSSVKILKRASASPWSLPLSAFNQLLTGYHVRELTRRVRVNGTITYYQPGYYRPGSAIVLQNGNDSLWVKSLTDKPMRIGDLADVTGIPDIASGSPTLTHAEIEDKAEYLPVVPVSVTSQELAAANMAGMHHNDLVSIEGQVVMEVRGASQDEYVLVQEGQLFSAIFHHPDATSQLPVPPMRHISLGTRIRVTGICILQDTTLFSGKAPFEILLRSFDDIAIVARPSLLNERNLVLAVSVLLLAVIAVAGWGLTLRIKVLRQTAALSTRIAAEADLERRNAQLEQRRSHVLEDINGTEPLAHILEEVCELVSFGLNGAPCWCEVTDGARLGNYPAQAARMRVIRAGIPAHTGPALGAIFAAFPPQSRSENSEVSSLSMGSKLAALAIETRRLYADLLHRSEFDLLTDILNRFALDKHLEAQIEEARQNAGIFGLIYIDLDEFKQVNDLYGHNVGDLYLQEAALRMKRQLRSADMLARLGGDEFAALVPMVRNRAEVEEIAQRLERSFDEPFAVDGFALYGSASVGIALYPEDAANRDTLLNAADAAMYVAKHSKQHTGTAGHVQQQPGQSSQDPSWNRPGIEEQDIR